MIKLVPTDGKWAVWKGSKLLRLFEDKTDAEEFTLRLAEDTRWEASNRD